MSGIIISKNKYVVDNLPQNCRCGCGSVILSPPYYWKTLNGKRRYYTVKCAVRLNIISWNEVASEIKKNKALSDRLKEKRKHTIATKLPKNRIRELVIKPAIRTEFYWLGKK